MLFNDGADRRRPTSATTTLGFSFHDYCLTAGSRATLCDTLRRPRVPPTPSAQTAGTGDALLLTEFGATEDPASLDADGRARRRNMIGWQDWHYCGCDDPTTSGPGDTQAIVLDPAKPPAGDNLDTGKLDAALAAVPARRRRPAARRGPSRTGVFALAWKRARPRTTEVAVPRRAVPEAATASRRRPRAGSRAATPACSRSAPGAARSARQWSSALR